MTIRRFELGSPVLSPSTRSGPPATALPVLSRPGTAHDTPPPSAALLSRLAALMADMLPGASLAEALGVPVATVAAWERVGRAELRRVDGEPEGVIDGALAPYVAFARLVVGVEAISVRPEPSTAPPGGALALTDRIEDALVEAVSAGMSLTAAAGQVGVTGRTARAWRQRGMAVLERLEEGEAVWVDLDARECALAAFTLRIRRAEAEAERTAMRAVQEAIEGAREPDGTPSLDEHGRPVRPPDWRAAAWWLSHGPLRQRWRRSDSEGDTASAQVVAGRAEANRRSAQPLRVVLVESGAVPADG